MTSTLFVIMTVVFVLAILGYLYRRRQKLRKMEQEDAWMESLPDSEWDPDESWRASLSDYERFEE